MELNSAQKAAVEHGEGPLLIIAGAGTGKTRVITSRILNLLDSGKAGSKEFLALTFTEKAANEMLERVDASLPLGYEEMAIKTFHGFADQVLRESGLEMGLDPGYKILTEVDQWFFFKKHLYEFELDFYRPLGNPNKFIKSLLSFFGKLKDELIDPEMYLKFAEAVEDEEERKKTVEIAKTYMKYQELMVANNCLDFADLCFYANRLFDERPACLKSYQERFKYVLVDEFQDTNYSQFQLVLKLVAGHRNLTVVGDDDQSIYKWRGASISNIIQFQEKFSDAKKVVLTENYRSEQAILSSAYELVKNNNPDRLEEKLGIDKNLNCNVSGENQVEIHQFPNYMQEGAFVAEEILRLQNENQCNFSDFAILLRSNSQAHAFVEELKSRGIPYQVRSPKGLLSLSEVKDLLAVLRVLANPYDDISLLRVLKMDVFGVSMQEILKLLNSPKAEHLFDSLRPEEVEQESLPGTESGLLKIYRLLGELMELSRNESVASVLKKFLDDSGLLQSWVETDNLEALNNVNEFAKQVNRFERENEECTVLDFVRYLEMLEEANSTLAADSFADLNSVQVLTVHGSKGLEFDYVFVGSLVKGRFPGTKRSEPFEIPEELTNEVYPEGDFHIQEERRLFYVAMTRAKKKLHLTYSKQYEGSRAWKASPFLEEIAGLDTVKKVEHEEQGDALERLQRSREPVPSNFEVPKLERKRFSYSQFETFKTCPLKYSYRYILKVPVPSSHAGNFGSSVHETLNEFYRALKNGKSVSLELMEELYKKNWIPYGYETMDHEKERFEKGWEMLKVFYEKNSTLWVVPSFLERPFNLRIGEYLVNGRIDRIDKLEDGTFEVIDYKTGRLKQGDKLDRNLQLSIYALACRDVLNINVSKLSLYYLEDGEKVSSSRDDKSMEQCKEELLSLIGDMKQSDFAANPGFHCSFCDFKNICPAV